MFSTKKIDAPQILITLCATITFVVIIFFIGFIFLTAFPTFQSQGLYLLFGQTWDYEKNIYGGLDYILGTLALIVLTMVIAIPISIFTAIFLSEFAPQSFRNIARPMIELLVGIPSVVYGIFGLFILEPIFMNTLNPFISGILGFIPIFHASPGSGNGILLASTVLSIMVLPTIIAISEDSLRSVPAEYREASVALGTTRWETVKKIALPVAMSGILTGIVLGMMRAMGETMAVVMLMGNSPHIPTSIFDSGYAMTSKILGDAETHIIVDQERSAMFAIAALLFIMEMILVVFIKAISSRRRVK